MSEAIITVENLAKKYVISHKQKQSYTTMRDTLVNGFRNVGKKLLGKKQGEAVSKEEFWALKDINFEIKQGDRVGIIGKNGAGKSTLLKILSRITEPTQGKIHLRGRVASLLEVGTGFHPELTGRENIFLNGAIMGMSKAEIIQKFDEIVAFAEVEKFLDTPVKRYSSGMYVRLAFAVAAHLEPEILVVDEVLAVGDAAFQKKCLGKMEDIGKEGRTVLFVSHNMMAVETLTEKILLMNQGQCEQFLSVKEGIEKYLLFENGGCTEVSFGDLDKPIFYKSIKSREVEGDLEISIDYICREDVRSVLSLKVINHQGITAMAFRDTDVNQNVINKKKGCYKVSVRLPKNILSPGRYFITFSMADMISTRFHYVENALSFEVNEVSTNLGFSPEGILYLPREFKLAKGE